MSNLPSSKTRRSDIISLSHISTVSDDSKRVLVDFEVDVEVSAWLAWYHVATGSFDALIPEVHNRLASCDVDFNLTMRDTQFSAINAAGQFLEAYKNIVQDDEANGTNQSISLIGTVRSVESSAMSFLSSVYNIPQIASSSTATFLNNKDAYPLFARTVPTNQGDASAIVLYLKNLNASHVGVFYIADGYGNDFHADVARELVASNITVLSIQYDDFAIEKAIKEFATSNFKYVIAIFNPGTWKTFIRYAIESQIIGRPDYFWVFTEASLEFADPSFILDAATEKDLASALHGSAIISATEPLNEIFDQHLTAFSENITMQQEFINQHVEPFIFDNYTFSTSGASLYQYLSYDAALALMLAKCDVTQQSDENSFLAGRLWYEQLLRTEFQGVSGHVSFDPTTGTRQAQSILYGVRNVLLMDHDASSEYFRFTSGITTSINLQDERLDHRVPFVYSSNTTLPPLTLPPVEMNLNLITTAILAFGWSLCGFVLFVSMFWMVWTLHYRNRDVVKASQPIFLCQICIGTFLITSAIIPMSFQEPINQRALDVACMATPWLVSMGFVTAFSALFTKTWRLNKLFRNSRNMRRVVIRPRHVVLPLIVLISINFAVMLAWTIDAPLIWQRSAVANFDTFGRSIESVGRCAPSNHSRATVYLALIIVIDLSVLIFSNYQAYLARSLPTDFSESTYIAIAMASMLEICFLAAPLLFFTSSEPSVEFVIRSLLASVTSLSILIPIFLPKYIRQNTRQRLSAANDGRSPRRSQIFISAQSSMFSESMLCNAVSEAEYSSPRRGTVKISRNEAYFDDLSIRINDSSMKKVRSPSLFLKNSSDGSPFSLRKNSSNASPFSFHKNSSDASQFAWNIDGGDDDDDQALASVSQCTNNGSDRHPMSPDVSKKLDPS